MEKGTFSNKKLLSSASFVPSANRKLRTNPNHSVKSAIFGHYNQTIAKVNPIWASYVENNNICHFGIGRMQDQVTLAESTLFWSTPAIT